MSNGNVPDYAGILSMAFGVLMVVSLICRSPASGGRSPSAFLIIVGRIT